LSSYVSDDSSFVVGTLGKVFQIGTVCYNWPMSTHASQAFSIAHAQCTDSEDLPTLAQSQALDTLHFS